MKKYIYIQLMGICLLNCCFTLKSEGFNFLEHFNRLSISQKLQKIKTYKSSDEFEINLSKCNPSFYKGVEKFQTYYLNDKKSKNPIIITEYIFSDLASADTAFTEVYQYAEYRRNLPRKEFNTLCLMIPDSQIYYALKRGTHIYLFTMQYNFVYHSADESVETNMRNNKEIVLDDLYNELGSKLKL